MEEVLKHLGTPAFATGIYIVFHYLDRVSSDEAKQAFSDWFKAKYDSSVVANALVEVFDRLYTRPLWGWEALLRSALFTTVITAIVALVFRSRIQSDLPFLFGLYLTNVISGYISLYQVRLWLSFTAHKPFVALVTGAIVGAIVILVSTNLVFLILLPFYGEPGDIWVHLQWLRDVVLFNRPLNGEILIAGLLVHVWLLLFAMGALLMQVLNGVLYASKTMQWFLDKGDQHPLEAIGIVATALALLANAAFLAVRYTTSG